MAFLVNTQVKLTIITKEIALITPSSATVERLFSIFNNVYKQQQANALEDLKYIGVMLRYNENFRSNLKNCVIN
jgi:hypothetical protein